MNVLIKGGEPLKRVELLLKLKSFRSEDMKGAIKSYLVAGMGESAAAALNGVDRNNLIKAIAKLNEVALIVENIKEVDWSKFKANQKLTTLAEVS
jgi:hypothetical protein